MLFDYVSTDALFGMYFEAFISEVKIVIF